MDKYEYIARLHNFDFSDAQLLLARELPGFSLPYASVLSLLHLLINIKRRPKMDALMHLAKLTALLDAPRNGIFSETDIEEFFAPYFI
jgi:hypothetical protein